MPPPLPQLLHALTLVPVLIAVCPVSVHCTSAPPRLVLTSRFLAPLPAATVLFRDPFADSMCATGVLRRAPPSPGLHSGQVEVEVGAGGEQVALLTLPAVLLRGEVLWEAALPPFVGAWL